MEALPSIHHQHQSLCSSLHYCCPSLTQSTYRSLLRPSHAALSSSMRASSSPSPPSSDHPPQNLQFPEPKIPFPFNDLPKVPSFDPPLQNPQHPESKSPESFNFNPLPKLPSFASVTTVSAFLFLGFCQNRFISKPVTTLSPLVSVEESLDETINIEEIPGSEQHQGQYILRLELKEKIPIVHGFNKTKTDDDEAWEMLKEQVFSCGEQLELVRVGFEEILEKDQDCNKDHQDRVLEYLEVVDECKGLLKRVKLAMDRCERENGDVKHCLRFCNDVVARIRALEGDMVGALKHFKELEQE